MPVTKERSLGFGSFAFLFGIVVSFQRKRVEISPPLLLVSIGLFSLGPGAAPGASLFSTVAQAPGVGSLLSGLEDIRYQSSNKNWKEVSGK